MDADRFDALARDLGAVASRRRVLGRLAVLPVVGAIVGLVAPEDAAADHPVRRVQGRRERRRQHRRNHDDNHDNAKHRRKRPPGAHARDCPDGFVQCCSPRFVADIGAVCQQEYGRYGPKGFCWTLARGCNRPCGTQYDSEWFDRCNQDFGSCGGSGCWAFFVH